MTPELVSYDYDVNKNVEQLLAGEKPEVAKLVLEESLEETLEEESEAWKNQQPVLAEDLRCEATRIEQAIASIAIDTTIDKAA